MPKIGFERFTAMNDEMGELVAQAICERRMSIPWRIWEIVLCRMNNWGHAPFDDKEMLMLVCGAAGEGERRVVNRGLKILTELGRISPESTKLCVVVNDDFWRRGAGRGAWTDTCSEPSHRPHRRHMWSFDRGWVTDQRQLQSGAVVVPPTNGPVPVYLPPGAQWDQSN